MSKSPEKVKTAREIKNENAQKMFPGALEQQRVFRQKHGFVDHDYDDIKVRVIYDDPADEYVTFRAEPFTIGTIAIELAKGAVAWVGGRLIASFFGEPNKAVALQDASVRQLGELFKGLLIENNLVQANAKLASLQNNMLEYSYAPSSSRDRLEQATTDSLDLLANLEALGWIGIPSYEVAVGLRFLILQERYILSNDPGELLNLLSQYQRASRYDGETVANFHEKLYSVDFTPVFSLGGLSVQTYAYYRFGQSVYCGQNYQAALNMRWRDLMDFYNTNVAPVIDPRIIVQRNWDELRRVTRQKAIDAGVTIPDGL